MAEFTAFGELETAETIIQASAQFPYDILNSRLYTSTTAGSGSVSVANQKCTLSTGAATSSSAKVETKAVLNYAPGRGGLVRFAGFFSTPAAGNTQIIGLGDDDDGLFFGYNGTSFGVMRRHGGTDTWIADSDWSEDWIKTSDAQCYTLDPTQGNVYQIEYQWLGFGAIRFYIEDQATGKFRLVHMIEYANQNTTTSINNPTLPLMFESNNTTNDTDVTIDVSSMMAGTQGRIDGPNVRWSKENSKTISAGTELAILNIRAKTTYQSANNRVPVVPDFLSISSDGTKLYTFKVYLNASVAGAVWADIDADDSVVEFDLSGTVSSGTEILSIDLGKTDSDKLFIKDLNIVLSPGDSLSVTAESPANGDAGVSVGWNELF